MPKGYGGSRAAAVGNPARRPGSAHHDSLAVITVPAGQSPGGHRGEEVVLSLFDVFRRPRRHHEAAPGAASKALTPGQVPPRRGFEYGIPRGGHERGQLGEATETDRRSQLQQLYESFLVCP
jgi:hypothetical protein